MCRTALVIGSLFLVLALPAQAAQPERALPPQPVELSFVDDRCGFDVLIEGEGKEGFIFFDGSARLIFPGLRTTLTNLETGETISLNDAGPGSVTDTVYPDGSFSSTLTGTGNWTHGLPDDIVHTTGLFTETVMFDSAGNLVDHELDLSRARVISLCDALA